MKKIKEMFNDPETSDIFKTVSIFSIFVLFFGLTLTIRNANDTFAATEICPDGWKQLTDKCSYKQYSLESECNSEAAKYNFNSICAPVEDSYGGVMGHELYVDILTVNYNYDGGTAGKTTEKIYDGGKVTLPSLSKKGYKPIGWYYNGSESAGNPGSEIIIDSVYKKDKTVTLYAKWTPINYTITFDSNGGGTITSKDVLSETTISKSDLPTPTREGYTFDGWWYEGDVGEEDDHNVSENGYTVRSNITLVAHWKNEQKTEYQVTFDVYDGKLYEGTKELTSLTIKLSDLDYSKYTAVKDNKTFNGWTLTKGDCKEPYKTGTKNLEKDTTIYACYTDNTPSVVEHQVTFDVDGGKLYNETTELSTLTIKLSSIDYSKFTAKKDNKTFNGWTLTKGVCTSPLKTGTNKLEKAITVYACYTDNAPAVTEYQVTFDVDGGKLFEGTTENTALTKKLSELDYSKFTATKENKTFNGWTLTKGVCTSPLKTGTTTIKQATTVYACYTDKKEDGETTNKTYSVTFKLNDGTLYKSSKKQNTNKFTLSAVNLSEYIAKKTGYEFDGWSNDSKCTKPTKTGALKLEKDTTLYACYTKNNASTTDKTDDEAEKNPQTGNALLYLLFITGIIALGYTGYKNSSVKK